MPKNAQHRGILDNLDVFEGTYSNLTVLKAGAPSRADRVETPEGIRAVLISNMIGVRFWKAISFRTAFPICRISGYPMRTAS